MSQDEPSQPDGEDKPQPEAPGPKAPPARPPGVPPLDTTKVPRAAPGAGSQRAQPGNETNPRNVIIAILVVAAVVCIVIVIAANSGGTTKETEKEPNTTSLSTAGTSSVAVSLAGNGSGEVNGSGIACPNTCTMTYSSETSVALAATPASGSTFRGWSGDCSGTEPCNLVVGSPVTVTATFIKNPGHTELAYPATEMTFERSQDYNIDHLPIKRGGFGEPEQDGFSMNIYEYSSGNGYDTHFEVDGTSGKVAAWTGQGEPSLGDCEKELGASGLREVHLPHQGEWLCAETDNHDIALIRYDGRQGETSETFKIFAKVYKLGG
jgi:Divergent InlB B-repeat domain